MTAFIAGMNSSNSIDRTILIGIISLDDIRTHQLEGTKAHTSLRSPPRFDAMARRGCKHNAGEIEDRPWVNNIAETTSQHKRKFTEHDFHRWGGVIKQ